MGTATDLCNVGSENVRRRFPGWPRPRFPVLFFILVSWSTSCGTGSRQEGSRISGTPFCIKVKGRQRGVFLLALLPIPPAPNAVKLAASSRAHGYHTDVPVWGAGAALPHPRRIAGGWRRGGEVERWTHTHRVSI